MPKHIHQFLRVKAKKTHTWTCIGCSWFVHEGLAHIVTTKDSICWSCGDEFRVTEAALVDDKPRCDACRGISSDAIDQLLREKGLADE